MPINSVMTEKRYCIFGSISLSKLLIIDSVIGLDLNQRQLGN